MPRISLLLVSLAIAGCAPSTKPPVVVDQAAISREQAIQERMASTGAAGHAKPLSIETAGFVVGKLTYTNTEFCPDRDLAKTIYGDNIEVCKVVWAISNDSSINAYANGREVYISSGMMNFVIGVDEFAFIFGHEMAHNLLAHRKKKDGNAVLGAIMGGIIGGTFGVNMVDAGIEAGRSAYSQSFETEADYLGMYLAARAGYNVNAVPNLWRRMAIATPSAIHSSFGSTHPSSVERFLNLEATAREIERKKAAGLPLVPEKR